MKQIPYARQWIFNDDIRAVTEALRSPMLTQGPLVEVFEKKIARYCDARYAVAVNSGTSALHIACLAAGINKQDEVITSPISFVASANCILYCGGTPVFADVEPDTVTIDPECVKAKITKKTRAIIPVHFAGHPCDLKRIHAIAKKHNLIVIEDAAHALGAEYRGERIGNCRYSDMTILSFHAVKHITTGEGGMVLTNRRELYEKLLLYRNHGITRDARYLKKDKAPWYYEMRCLGFNYRITDLQCALGISQLSRLSGFLKKRREIVATYNSAFSDYHEIVPLREREYARSAHHIYVLRFRKKSFKVSRDAIFQYYLSKGIKVNMHYIPIYLQPFYSASGYEAGIAPFAEKYYEEAITLPLFPKMTGAQLRRIIVTTREIIEQYRVKKIF